MDSHHKVQMSAKGLGGLNLLLSDLIFYPHLLAHHTPKHFGLITLQAHTCLRAFELAVHFFWKPPAAYLLAHSLIIS